MYKIIINEEVFYSKDINTLVFTIIQNGGTIKSIKSKALKRVGGFEKFKCIELVNQDNKTLVISNDRNFVVDVALDYRSRGIQTFANYYG